MMVGLLLSVLEAGCSRDETTAASSVKIVIHSILDSKSGPGFSDDISSIDVFLYHNNLLESHTRAEGSSLSISVPRNVELDWIAVANAPDDVDPHGVSLLSDNRNGRYVMIGDGHGRFTEEGSVFTPLYRMMCRIEIASVSPDEGLTRVFLEHASSWASYDIDGPEAGGWTDGEVSLSSIPGTLYCYPNPYGTTKLVVEYGPGNLYKADLPPLESNTIYLINEIRVDSRQSVELSVSVKPWTYNEVNVDLKSVSCCGLD